MWVTKADSSACEAGALPRSEMPFSSQKQCHISSPVPYVARVSSSHACIMVSFTRLCSIVLIAGSLCGGEWELAGTHNLRRSLARQCGRNTEGIGVRFCGYGAGLLGAASEEEGMGRLRGLESLVLRRLGVLGWLLIRFSPGSLLRANPSIAAFLARLLWVRVDEERFKFWRHWDVRE